MNMLVLVHWRWTFENEGNEKQAAANCLEFI